MSVREVRSVLLLTKATTTVSKSRNVPSVTHKVSGVTRDTIRLLLTVVAALVSSNTLRTYYGLMVETPG